jgi:hypothetical protein
MERAAIVLGPADQVCTAQILWINLVTTGLQDVAIAFEPGKKNIIGRKPRPPVKASCRAFSFQRMVLVISPISMENRPSSCCPERFGCWSLALSRKSHLK